MPTRRKSERKAKAVVAVVSLRGYARHLGVTLKGIQKAIASGRLRESIRDGKIIDVELADREWAASRSKPANGGGHQTGDTLVDAQTRVAIGRALALELANKLKSGDLLDAATVERENFAVARMLRDRILNVPDRLGELQPAVRSRLRAELRQALGDIAEDIDRG